MNTKKFFQNIDHRRADEYAEHKERSFNLGEIDISPEGGEAQA